MGSKKITGLAVALSSWCEFNWIAEFAHNKDRLLSACHHHSLAANSCRDLNIITHLKKFVIRPKLRPKPISMCNAWEMRIKQHLTFVMHFCAVCVLPFTVKPQKYNRDKPIQTNIVTSCYHARPRHWSATVARVAWQSWVPTRLSSGKLLSRLEFLKCKSRLWHVVAVDDRL